MSPRSTMVRRRSSSAGNTRGLIEASVPSYASANGPKSSAGNTRGLIEANVQLLSTVGSVRLPRGIPAASLKRPERVGRVERVAVSSAGNTRGLIEARRSVRRVLRQRLRLPRGIPAASLKRDGGVGKVSFDAKRLPRGIPAASLKRTNPRGLLAPRRPSSAGNTRGLIEA